MSSNNSETAKVSVCRRRNLNTKGAGLGHAANWVLRRCMASESNLKFRRWHYWHLVAIAGTASRLAVTLGWIQEIRSISIVLIEIVYCEYSLRGA